MRELFKVPDGQAKIEAKEKQPPGISSREVILSFIKTNKQTDYQKTWKGNRIKRHERTYPSLVLSNIWIREFRYGLNLLT